MFDSRISAPDSDTYKGSAAVSELGLHIDANWERTRAITPLATVVGPLPTEVGLRPHGRSQPAFERVIGKSRVETPRTNALQVRDFIILRLNVRR